MSLFGEMSYGGELELAVVEHLRRWMPTYCKEVARQHSSPLAEPKSYTVVSEYARWPENGLPAVIVESAGLVDEPEESGERFLSGTFAVEVAMVVQGKDAISTRRQAQHYGLAVIGSMLQHRKLSDLIFVSKMTGAGFAGQNLELRRTSVVVAAVFEVTHEKFLNTGEGPIAPDPEGSPPEWPTVVSTEVDVEEKEE
jgi:hypothetical protein